MGGLTIVFGLIWGLFIAFVSKVDGITALIGMENSNGVIGVVLLISGMLGSIAIPAVSDYTRRRKRYFFISVVGILFGFISFAVSPLFTRWAGDLAPSLAIAFSGLLGFFFMGAIPLGIQYASELSYPTPESASQGLLLLAGYFMGTLVLLFMVLQGGVFLERVLTASVALLFAACIGILFIKESPVIITEDERLREAVDKESVHLE
jgi:FLVCR family feline leukemia virus subgroup C receptor-related protein